MLELKLHELPQFVQELPAPPQQLFYEGEDLLELLKKPRVAIVGSRAPTLYGRQVAEDLAAKLAGQGIVIISGLAYGIDSIAQQAALDASGRVIAVLPSPLDNIVPSAHRGLAQEILGQGGALVSEYPSGTIPFKRAFVARNRLMSGLSNGVLVIEAAEKSGTLHTARFALEQNINLMAVPGNIYSTTSRGCNDLLKSGQAALITSYKDVLHILDLADNSAVPRVVKGRNDNEQAILDLMSQGISDAQQLIERTGLEVSKFNQSLIMLEISGKIRALGANHWAIR